MDAPRRTPGLTDEQQRALATRHVSVALAAGAGCGKTHVLTERFLAHIEPGPGMVDLSEIVAITFTERAAREMRDRIRKAVERRLTAARQDAEHWLQLVRRMDAARISTIHAFCAALLRAHAVEARLDPQFRVLQEAEAANLLAETTDDVLRLLLARRDENLRGVLAVGELRSLREDLTALVRSRHRQAMGIWLERTPEEIASGWESYFREVYQPARLNSLLACPDYVLLTELVGSVEPPPGNMAERFAGIRACQQELRTQPLQARVLIDLAQHARVQHAKPKNWAEPEQMQAFRQAAEVIRERAKDLSKTLDFDPVGAIPAATYCRQLLAISQELAAAYQQRKDALQALDFDDLLLGARELLHGPEAAAVRREVSQHIKVLLIDEFQDTDAAQVDLVNAICNDVLDDGKLFFVGDHKQSIYRFRGAEPEVFHQLRARIPPEGQLPLSRNFRSQPAILDFVNAIFTGEFAEYQPLVAARPQVTRLPAIEFIWAEMPEEPDEPEGPADQPARRRRKLEADWIARRLRQLIDSREPLVWDAEAAQNDRPAARPARQGDVALLFRAMSDAYLYEDALRRWGFDYYVVGGQAFYAQQEIYDVLNLLRAVASPADALSLVGALRSPIFALADDTIFWLAQHPEGIRAGLFAAPVAGIAGEQAARVRFAGKVLGELTALRDRRPVAELLTTALARTGYDAALLADFLGERQVANLHKLIDQARQFDASGTLTLTDFIRQLAEFVVRQPREPLAATQPESQDVVRLMSIHQAKGLEFPIVVLPDLERKRRGGGRSPAAFHPVLGPLAAPPEKLPSIGGWEMYQALEKEAEEAEHARLFYVATTRAADMLLLAAACDQIDKPSHPWRQMLAKHFDLRTGEYHGPRPAGRGVPVVQVITEPPEVLDSPQGKPRSANLSRLIADARQRDDRTADVPGHVGAVPVDHAARRSFSFSRLGGVLRAQHLGDDVEIEEEDLLAIDTIDAPADGRALGILVHAALAAWVRGRSDASGTAESRAARWVEQFAAQHGSLAPRDVATATALVARFLASARAAAIAAAATVQSELEFLLAWPHDGQTLQIRGIIDCLYQDRAGAWHLVDYKSEAAANTARAAAPYRLQALVYALAVEASLGAAPQEIVLHFLRGGGEQPFVLDDESRAWAAAEIDRRIKALWQEPART
ncbi:MAG: UvrD-helicase domain-containing protein [Pirellulales bacterium]|nr:UvrD-helicase domain-containing protein [Pirellulales bacterium]